MSKKKRSKGSSEASVEMDAAVAVESSAEVSVDAAVAVTGEAKATLDASVADAAGEAAQALGTQFPNPETDWNAIQSILSVTLTDLKIVVEPGIIKVVGVPVEQAKDASARIWRCIAELRREGKFQTLPTVEVVS